MKKETKIVEASAESVQATLIPEETAATAAKDTAEKKPAKAPRKTAEKKPAATKATTAKTAKKTADKPAARTKKSAVTTKVVVELANKSASSEMLVERAKEDWVKKGNVLADIKELAIYINATEGMVYYVVNDDYLSGSFAF